ncbi:MAG: S-methyl-5-thioribose-1-phosphate isomerase [Firmicutes bacterium]|nr:S-methyl-5-thioribose-1-phosphate isomerase [Bacillota bacterium]
MNNIQFNDAGTGVIIIDQTLLPNEEEFIELATCEEMYEAIKKLRVRGAPAIGIFAGYALAALAASEAEKTEDRDEFLTKLGQLKDYLVSSRPTAVNLAWAAERVMKVAMEADADISGIAKIIREEAILIHEEDKAMCKAIAEFGVQEIKRLAADNPEGKAEFGILTHCNAGPLATSEYGTALGPILLGNEEGIRLEDGRELKLKAFADETRPLLQGARLTSYELHKAGVDVTLICDNMASIVMKNGWINACFVGCDRVAANGDAANKIGTSGVAILAKHYGIPFYVLGPTSTIDINCKSGEDIPIEERDPDEIKNKFYEKSMALSDVMCYNPAFDVTDHSLISGIITEKGILRPPYEETIDNIFQSR